MTDLTYDVNVAMKDHYISSNPTLRFVSRDGRLILQYAEVRRYPDRQETVWVDVPLADETPKA